MSPQHIRKHIRQQRRGLSEHECQAASSNVVTLISEHLKPFAYQHIAIYLAQHGEIDPFELTIHHHWHNKHFYYPIIGKRYTNQMHFGSIDAPMGYNRFDIPEPKLPRSKQRKPTQLDLVIVPLVAFDRSGNRMGMGGGYYDRSFQFRRYREHFTKPLLVGVAHHFQEQENLPNQPWDVPLDAVVTDKEFIWI